MKRHDKHYEEMPIQPYAVMRQAGVLEGYLIGAALKYIMRAGAKDEAFPTKDIQKAIAVLTDYLTEVEVPF